MAEHVRTLAQHMHNDAPHVRQQAATAITRRRLFSTAHTALPCVLPWQHVILHVIYTTYIRRKGITRRELYVFPIARGAAEYISNVYSSVDRTHPAFAILYRIPVRQNPYNMHVTYGNSSIITTSPCTIIGGTCIDRALHT